MSTRLQSNKAATHGIPDFKELLEETDDLMRRQRQKGAEYKFREGPGRPRLALDGDASPVASAASAKDETMKAGATASANNASSLDNYDPNEQAAREQKALVDTVSRMRAEASHLAADVATLTQKYDSMKASLEQLAYQDDVDTERRQGLNKMRDLKARIHFLTLSLEDAEHYSKVLTHMTKRLTDEKLSKIATMKAFEDALRVHKNELELVQDVQRSAIKSRDEEMAELVRLQAEVRRQVANLDRKLEARRLEVKVRQEKAKWRLTKLQEEMSLKAQAEGDLTEEEERAMIAKAQNLSQEAAELRAERVRAQADADQSEKEYTRIRVSAGIVIPADAETTHVLDATSPVASTMGGTTQGLPLAMGAGEGDEDAQPGSFITPDPLPIIVRFNTLEEEMRQVEDQLADYNIRYSTLQQQMALLRGLAEPRAKDERDEEDKDLSELQALRDRIVLARRGLESGRESDDVHQLRVQLEQSVTVLMERMEGIPAPLMAMAARHRMSPEEAEVMALAFADLDTLRESHASVWSRTLHDRIVGAIRHLHTVMRALDSTAAGAAMDKAQVALARHLAGESHEAALGSTSRSAAASGGDGSTAMGQGGGPGSRGSRSAAGGGDAIGLDGTAAEAEEEAAAAVEADRRIDATIESMIVKNEWSIRVRPGSGADKKAGGSTSKGGASGGSKAISGRALAEAVQAFEKTWKDVSSGVVTATPRGHAAYSTTDYLPSGTYPARAPRPRDAHHLH